MSIKLMNWGLALAVLSITVSVSLYAKKKADSPEVVISAAGEDAALKKQFKYAEQFRRAALERQSDPLVQIFRDLVRSEGGADNDASWVEVAYLYREEHLNGVTIGDKRRETGVSLHLCENGGLRRYVGPADFFDPGSEAMMIMIEFGSDGMPAGLMSGRVEEEDGKPVRIMLVGRQVKWNKDGDIVDEEVIPPDEAREWVIKPGVGTMSDTKAPDPEAP
ncbi:MAG: hypothetical protein ACLFVN_06915 [Phycisphaeraceae bacterium]